MVTVHEVYVYTEKGEFESTSWKRRQRRRRVHSVVVVKLGHIFHPKKETHSCTNEDYHSDQYKEKDTSGCHRWP